LGAISELVTIPPLFRVCVQEFASGVLSNADSDGLNEAGGTKTESDTTPAQRAQYTPGVPAKRHPGRPRKPSPSPAPLDPAISGYLASSGSFLIQSADTQKKTFEMAEARFKLETQKSRLSLLQSVLENDSVPQESKDLALSGLNKMLQAIHDDL
jgi:hypothetical protein